MLQISFKASYFSFDPGVYLFKLYLTAQNKNCIQDLHTCKMIIFCGQNNTCRAEPHLAFDEDDNSFSRLVTRQIKVSAILSPSFLVGATTKTNFCTLNYTSHGDS